MPNLPGVMPSQQDVESIARSTLGLDEELETPVPQFYLPVLQQFLKDNPYDTNFIVELALPKSASSSLGGNGYGLVTCMDEFCWKDIALGPDPLRPKGGLDDGFGSFFDYAMHCRDPDHAKGRIARCHQNGINIHAIQSNEDYGLHSPPSTSFSSNHSPSANFLSAIDAAAGHPLPSSSANTIKTKNKPHPFFTSSPVPSSTRFATLSPIAGPSRSSMVPLHPSKILPDTKPSISSGSVGDVKPKLFRRFDRKEDAITVLSDDSEDEILPLSETQIPQELRKVTNKDSPYVLSDDEDMFLPRAESSTAVLPQKESLRDLSDRLAREALERRSQGSTSGRTPWTLPQRLEALRAEERFCIEKRMELQKRPVVNALYIGQLTKRSAILIDLLCAGGMASYIPPPPLLLSRFPEIAKWNPDKTSALAALPTSDFNTIQRLSSGPSYMGSTGMRLDEQDRIHGHMDPVNRDDALAIANSYTFPRQNPSIYPSSHATALEYERGALGMPGAFPHMPGYMSTGYSGMPGAGPDYMLGMSGATYPDLMDMYDDGYEFNRVRGSEDLKTFFNDALNDFSENNTIEDSLKTLGLLTIGSRMPGLAVTLMAHQVLGVSFMIGKEKDKKYLGGILGDAMGLGKTVQAIATIVGHPSEDPKVKTTLVVAPLALLNQWKTEIETKTEPPLKVLIYHGAARSGSLSGVKSYDVVITTMGCLSGEYPREIKKPNKKKKKSREMNDFVDDDEDEDHDKAVETMYKKRGLLFRMKWYRVIIDEAHGIRNRNTHAAKAAFELDSHLRWSLTGTIIINTLTDVYSHLHFLGIGPHADWKHFSQTIHTVQVRRPKLASKRMQAILRTCMLRRTKDSELDGKKLLILPPKTVDVVELEFSPEERAIYNAIEMRAKVRFNKFVKLGTVLKNYHVVLVLLMRLRQLTCHPWLIRRANGEPLSEGDLTVTDDDIFGDIDAPRVDGLSEVARAATLLDQDFVKRVKEKLKARYLHLRDADGEMDRDQGGEHDIECSICFDAFVDERITSCGHSFCSSCMDDWFNNVAAPGYDLTDEQVQQGVRSCPLCRAHIHKSRIFRAEAFFHPDELEENDVEMVESGDKGKGKGKEKVKAGYDSDDDEMSGSQAEEVDEDDENDWNEGKITKKFGKRRAIDDGDDVKPKMKKLDKGKSKAVKDEDEGAAHFEDEENEKGIEDVLPSTKMLKMAELIAQWEAEDKTQKILVFSQFTSFLSLIALDLDRRNIPYVTYLGSHSQKDREEAVKKFTTPSTNRDSPRVMLISLKAGGVGLNLTVANRVIMLDLAWNLATEHQAIDRAHRIGQTRPVKVERLVIRDTVEQRMLQLQEKKQSLADGALGEGAGKLGRLTVADLTRLFFGDDGVQEV